MMGPNGIMDRTPHVCGVQGFNPMLGDKCQGCDDREATLRLTRMPARDLIIKLERAEGLLEQARSQANRWAAERDEYKRELEQIHGSLKQALSQKDELDRQTKQKWIIAAGCTPVQHNGRVVKFDSHRDAAQHAMMAGWDLSHYNVVLSAENSYEACKRVAETGDGWETLMNRTMICSDKCNALVYYDGLRWRNWLAGDRHACP
jgi:hypothetical protein